MNNLKKLRIATRQSQLALWQTEWVANNLKKKFPDLEIELVKITTKGDKILDKSLSKIGGKGLFVKELEQAMLDNKADIAVHSLKDMPANTPEELELAVYCERADFRDVLLTKHNYDLSTMPLGATIGTSSVRRGAQLKKYRSDLNIVSLRGNVNTRISKAFDEENDFDGIILASAGVHRIGQEELIKQYLSTNAFLPAPGQGIVVIECRRHDNDVKNMIKKLACAKTTVQANAERAFNRVMGGSCQIPIASLAEFKDENEIILHGEVTSPDGVQQVSASIEGESRLASDLGERLAERILRSGGSKIIADIDANL